MASQEMQQQFQLVIQANKGIIYKVANSYCHNAEDRKDLLQEIIIQLWLGFEKYDKQFALTTWIYRIALNVSISFYRKEGTRSAFSQPLYDDLIYFEEENPNSQIDSNLIHLQSFIKELREIDRAIILLYLEGKTYQETAGILGLSVKNISVRVFRIKELLRNKFATIKP